MNSRSKQHRWCGQLQSFSSENRGRPTRLGVFEPTDGGTNDFWLENGLPLQEVVFENHNGSSFVEMIFDGFTHTISNARRMEFHVGISRNDDGLNVVDANGRTSVLRFEDD